MAPGNRCDMRKFTLELPKVRLELNLKLIKRRKPLVQEPLIPSTKLIKRKYRKGSMVGRIARHFSEHKKTKKVVLGNMAAFIMVGAFLPGVQAQQSLDLVPGETAPKDLVIQSENTLITQKSLQYPVDKYRLNQGFSYFHPGIDFGDPTGTPVKPIKSGSVTEAGYSKDGYGNTVLVDHGSGLVSRYAHLSKIEVTVGANVTTQTEIGEVGSTGKSTGPHLHLEIHLNGKAINPISYLSR